MSDLGRKTLRATKNVIGGYSEIQIKVRKATSNDPSGPAGHNLQEIAAGTYNTREFNEVMEMLDKRLNDSGKNWRHVYKALIVLDYLLHNGSEQVVLYTKENVHIIKTLKEFQYVDESGRDQGANVRQKVKDVMALLADENRLREERGASGSANAAGGFGGSNLGGGGAGGNYYNEDSEVQKAMEESRRTALQDERKRLETLKSEKELQMALELSEEEARAQRKKESEKDQIDFFSPVDDGYNPNAVNYVTPQQYQQNYGYQNNDPFAGFNQQPQQQQQFNGFDNFAMQQQQQQPMMQDPNFMNQNQMGFGNVMQPQNTGGSNVNNPFTVPQQAPKPNPFSVQPQSQGEMPTARAGVNLDPFASISASRSSTVTKPSTAAANPFGSGSGNQQQRNTAMGDLLTLDGSHNSGTAQFNNTGGGSSYTAGSGFPHSTSGVGFNHTGGSSYSQGGGPSTISAFAGSSTTNGSFGQAQKNPFASNTQQYQYGWDGQMQGNSGGMISANNTMGRGGAAGSGVMNPSAAAGQQQLQQQPMMHAGRNFGNLQQGQQNQFGTQNQQNPLWNM